MPLTLPNLDDRNFDDLVAEAIAMLPRYAPGWTNHNPSDPGITIIELLAYFTENLIYRLNRITRETKIAFLQLLCGAEKAATAGWGSLPNERLDDALRQAVRELRRTERIVSREDYEDLVQRAIAQDSEQNPWAEQILRTVPFERRNLELADAGRRQADAPGHVSLVVVPSPEARGAVPALLAQVRAYLEPRRLITTRLHVVQPFYIWIRLGATLHPRPAARDLPPAEAAQSAITKLEEYFSPFPGGGPQGEGWPLGRALYLSEIYEALEQVPEVDYVEDVNVISLSEKEDVVDDSVHIGIQVGRSRVSVDARLGAAPELGPGRVVRDAAGNLAGIALRPYELIRIASNAADFSVAGVS